MTFIIRLALAQFNPTVGDLHGNLSKINTMIQQAHRGGAQIVVFPELAVTGYPPQDLLYERQFVRLNRLVLDDISKTCPETVVIVGYVDFDQDWNLYNSAAVIAGGSILARATKTLLPSYDVFDETRYFKSGLVNDILPVRIDLNGRSVNIGLEICEDLWDDRYDIKVTDILVNRGADLILNISASPFYMGKRFERERLVRSKAVGCHRPIILVNMVGGQDDLVFDGQSLGADASGNIIAYGRAFEEDLIFVDIDIDARTAPSVPIPPYDKTEEIFKALVMGIHDYFVKTGFKRAILGLSGGIDSSVTACIAAEALGPKNVIGVSMPSRFSSSHSKTDAEILAENLGIHFLRLPIQDIVDVYNSVLSPIWHSIRMTFDVSAESEDPVADENIQPRVRSNCLMDLSNRFKELGILVINTGNKTELALGFCTLYGDMTGGIGALGDVSKLQVYELAHYINRRAGREIIPKSVIEKTPSPELRPNQVDPFDFSIVSPMVDDIVERRLSRQELVDMGYPPDVVDDVYRRIRAAEYKRRQAPPCIKITRKAFGIGWKMPIVNHYIG